MKYSPVKKLVISAACIALCVVLPMVFHSFPGGGNVFLPMHIPVLLCGLMMGLVHTRKTYLDLYISMVTAMVAGRVISGLAKSLIFTPGTAPFAWVTTSLVEGIPGIAIQLVLIPTLVFALMKARLIPQRYPKELSK